MTAPDAALVIVVGLAAGLLSGLFGVGGGIVMTPGLSSAGLAPITAVATPLPVILPTAAVGAYTYGRAGQIDGRAARWISLPGAAASVAGAALTEVIDG
ncbi:MAG: TSUP family transporter [Actinomycetota bacterium]